MSDYKITDGVRELIYALEELRASRPEHESIRPAVTKVLAPDGFMFALPDGSRWVVAVYEQKEVQL